MTTENLTIQVPQALYHRLERLAALTRRPLESLVAQTLSSALPPLPDDLPTEARNALFALEALSDAELLDWVHATFPADQLEQWEDLRARRRAGSLSADEQARLAQLTQEAELLTLRKAYAAVLLKWRGQRLPSLADLETSV